MAFNVYFDVKEFNGELAVCVQVFEQGTKFEPVIKRVNVPEGATFLDNALEGFLLALEVIESEEFDEVILMNQNKIIFDWLIQNNYGNSLREAYYTQIKGKMGNIATNIGKIGTRVVTGDKNFAKKELKKNLKHQVEDVTDFTNMFKQETTNEDKEEEKEEKVNNVVRINRRAN